MKNFQSKRPRDFKQEVMVLGNLKLVFGVMVFFQVITKEGRIWIEIWEGWRRERLDVVRIDHHLCVCIVSV